MGHPVDEHIYFLKWLEIQNPFCIIVLRLVLLYHKMCEMEKKSILKMYLKEHFISTTVHDIYPWDSTWRIVKVRLFLEYQLYNFWARGGAVSAECSLGLGKMSLNLLEREIPATTSLNIVRAFHHPFSPCNGTRPSCWAEHPRADPCFAASRYRGAKFPEIIN